MILIVLSSSSEEKSLAKLREILSPTGATSTKYIHNLKYIQKYIDNHIKSNQILIVITIFRLTWYQLEFWYQTEFWYQIDNHVISNKIWIVIYTF